LESDTCRNSKIRLAGLEKVRFDKFLKFVKSTYFWCQLISSPHG
jgi:hypothetical protein